MAPNRDTGFLIVLLCLSSFITLYSVLDTLFLWTDAGQQKWNIPNPDASRTLAISTGLSQVFVLLFSAYLIYLLLRGEEVLHFVALLGWYFLSIGAVFGLLYQFGSQLRVEFVINSARGALLLLGVWMAKK